MKKKIAKIIKTIVQFILNPRLLLCFGIGWMITNGWSYVLFGLGTWMGNEWMIGISTAYLTLLWLPISPEKIVTITIAIWLMKIIFPNDEKTLGTLRQSLDALKRAFRRKKQAHQEKKLQKGKQPPRKKREILRRKKSHKIKRKLRSKKHPRTKNRKKT